MRLVRFLDEEDNVRFGTGFLDGYSEVMEGAVYEGMKPTGNRLKIKKLLAPVLPSSVMCIGLNYRAHAKETGMRLPEHPVLFMKNPASVTGHGDNIVLPESCRDPLQVDYEAELAVVIGKAAKNVSAGDAFDYILGYTAANDVSARIWQNHAGGKQWVRGKSFDTFCPLGPELVTSDEISDPGSLGIRCVLNGRVMQESNTSDMIFSVGELIAYLSQDTTLLPGTVILTGTPSGVGFTRNPPVFLKSGDTLETHVDQVGTLVSRVV